MTSVCSAISGNVFNLYICKLPIVVEHSLIVGYTDDHSLLKIIQIHVGQIEQQLNCDLEALYHFCLTWQIKFAPNKTCSLLISLRHDLQPSPHPPLFLNDSIIPETSTAQVLESTFDSLLS